MRRIRYVVATSLDGYIAGPNGEYDWIIMDPEIDFGALFIQFDTMLMGRKSFELTLQAGDFGMPKMKQFVFSRTLQQNDHPGVTIVADKLEETVASLQVETGKDIWLFGGGSRFRSLLDAGLIDTVEVAVIPVLLGGGIPMLEPPAKQAKLELTGHRVYGTGIVSLEYAVKKAA
jgi:dihydrofolate reductase